MKEIRKGKLIVIVAPSGSGKSTLITKLKVRFPSLQESVSFTTRAPREGEVNGKHYNFITLRDFEDKISKGDFLEYALVHRNYYGTSKSFVMEMLTSGADLLFDLDVQGADAMRSHFGTEAKIIFIAPPSLDELEKRLKKRGTETEEVIKIRLNNAAEELKKKNSYDYSVTNIDLKICEEELATIFQKILKG
jgi:guanylate kinase